MYMSNINKLAFFNAKEIIDSKYVEGFNHLRELDSFVEDYVDIYCLIKQSLVINTKHYMDTDMNSFACEKYPNIRISEEEIDNIAMDITQRCIKDLIKTMPEVCDMVGELANISGSYFENISGKIKRVIVSLKKEEITKK